MTDQQAADTMTLRAFRNRQAREQRHRDRMPRHPLARPLIPALDRSSPAASAK